MPCNLMAYRILCMASRVYDLMGTLHQSKDWFSTVHNMFAYYHEYIIIAYYQLINILCTLDIIDCTDSVSGVYTVCDIKNS